jgi:hypothetical protein
MSSTFGGVSAAQPAWAPTPQNGQPNPQQVLQPVAQLLGTTSQDLMSQMQSGTTLSDIASKQGVSQSDLINAIEQGLQSASPPGSTSAQSSQSLTTIATGIANGTAKVGQHHHHHHGAGSISSSLMSMGVDGTSDDDSDTSTSPLGPPTSTVSSLASLLGLDPNTVQQLLGSGTTVSGLATANGSGLPASDLQSLFSTGLQIDTTA